MPYVFQVHVPPESVDSIAGELVKGGGDCKSVVRGAVDSVVVLTVVASTLTIIDIVYRWSQSARQKGVSTITVTTATGKSISLDSVSADELKKIIGKEVDLDGNR